MQKKALLIDGNSLMFRAYYGSINQLDFFIKNNLEPTNAIKTMMLIIFKIVQNNQYDYNVIAFDHKDKNFRKNQFEDYKANRKKTPDSLVSQIEPIKEIMKYFGLNVYCISGIEADDVIGSAAKLLNENNVSCDIYSTDNDMLQLVNENNNVIQFKKGISETITFTWNNFGNLFYDLAPFQIPDFKAISGDNSDNLPGIKGVGPKSTISLLQKFKTLENIYKNIDLIDQKALKSKILEHKEMAFKCKELATILDNYFDSKSIEEFKNKDLDLSKLKQIVKTYNFSGFNKYFKDGE